MAIQQTTARLQPTQHRQAGEMLARAFYDDPLSVYLVPNDAKRARVLPWMYERVVRYGALYDGVLLTASSVTIRSSNALIPSSPLPPAGLSSSEAKEEGLGVREVKGELLTDSSVTIRSPSASIASSPLPLAGEGSGVREDGERLTTPDSIDGIAVWLPPGLSHTPITRLIRAGLALTPLKFGLGAMGRFMAANHVERLRAKLAPEPHWYLWVIGIEPEQQGRGLGSSLVEPMIARAETEGMPCYLETHKERNVAFYEKHGYNVVHSGNVPGSGPPYWCLKREPRR
jgi:GNAT superfamily N-acetyltransferase